jgi:glycosyltransferase involved in cell wall biosynthesis
LARAVEALVDEPERTVAMGQEARRQATAYDWEVQKARYLEIVDRLIASRDGR